jgi:alanine racemase
MGMSLYDGQYNNEDNAYCNSVFEVDTNIVVQNYEKVQNYIGADVGIIPVVKGNCYGYGLLPMADIYTRRCGAKIIANAAVFEAVQLRKGGIDSKIVIIGGVPRHLIPAAVEFDFAIPLFETETADILEEVACHKGCTAAVHIKIETGMNRLGVRPGAELAKLIDYLSKKKHIRVEGLYTHFATSTADYNDSFALEQNERFKQAVAQVNEVGLCPKYIHACNSAAIAWFKDAYYTSVRSSSSVLGHAAMEDGREPIGLTEPCSLRAYVTNVHEVPAGETVGYSRAWTAPDTGASKIATLSIGFADGIYPPWARTGGPVLIGGKRAKLIGLCMDQTFADVTGIPCKIGDVATLIGKDGDERITTRDIEVHTGQTFEYLLGTLGSRVARVYL